MTLRAYRGIHFFSAAVLVSFVCFVIFMATCEGSNQGEQSDSQAKTGQSDKQLKPPIIIWHFHSIRDTTESLQIALSSGLITHVSIG
ncbi:MAG TPA: hypothetical protein VMW23_07920, partial [Sedimentisphaerales bacterium]|nr:hypothetical protein [Sedimentisphaerales bacterium]